GCACSGDYRRRKACRRDHHRVHRQPHSPKNLPTPSEGNRYPCAPAPFFPPASTQFCMVAKGTKTRWSRHKCQLAGREGKPSSTTSRTARAITRCLEGRPDGARSARSALKYLRHFVQECCEYVTSRSRGHHTSRWPKSCSVR